MKIKTKLTDIFGIDLPIIQGGMQWLAIPAFASHFSNAGGMGTINVTCSRCPEEFADAIAEMNELTKKPYLVNVSLLPDQTQGDEKIFKYLDICAKGRVAGIEFAGANPAIFMPLCKEAGMKIVHKSPNAKVAKSMERKGADAITIAGYEVAGHPSQDGIGTFVIANKVASICDCPVMAAGGVADGKGLAAALALGASGVVVGTRFVATAECPASYNHKRWLLEHSERDTILIQKSIHNMMRVGNNMAAKLTCEMEARGTDLEELLNTVISGAFSKASYSDGNVDGSIYALGQAMGLVNDPRDVKPVAEVMNEMASDAKKILENLNTLFTD